MELIGLLSKIVKESATTKKILLEYPESTVKKLVDKYSKETDDTEDVIRKTISDFERYKSGFSNEDKDIFKHTYSKLKKLIADKQTKQQVKKNLDDYAQEFVTKYKGTDLQLIKLNIKKFFEIKTLLKKNKAFSKDILTYTPAELNELVTPYFTKFNRDGNNELVAYIADKFHKEVPDEDPMTTIVPRAQRYVRHYDLIPLRTKLVSFMNFEEFEHVVDGYTPMGEDEYSVPEIDTSDVDIAYEDDDILIFAPDQKHKCINIRKKFAPDRRWCTSWEGSSNYYYNYRLNQNLTLYYVINKNLPTTDLNYASVILVDKYGEMRLADGSNSGRYAGGTVIPWKEIVSKIPPIAGKEDYLVGKPFNDEDQAKMQKYKSYNLKTTDPVSELGGPEEVELWMELRGPDFKTMTNGEIIFGNLPDELQKKYIGLGSELSAQMVRALSPAAMSYYISKKKEKLLTKKLSELNENDIEVILSKEMRPYLRKLRLKYEGEIETSVDPDLVKINYPNDANGKFARMFGLEQLFDILPNEMTYLQLTNESKDDVTLKIPESISRFKDLTILICENIINSLPESIGECSQLSFLTLTGNKNLTTLPKGVGKLHCLNYIVVDDNNINIDKLPPEVTEYITPSMDDIWDINFPPELTQHCNTQRI